MQHDVSHRTFLGACGAAGAALAIGEASLAVAPAVAATPSWVDRPMRWAQLTLVEDDPGRFDLAFWLDYFRRTHSDAACLSAGGCVAYYPTEVPFHHRSRWLGDRDPFGELVKGCRKLGMVVLRGPTRTRPTTTSARRTPTGSPSTPRASRAGTGPRPRCGSPAPSGRTISSS